MRLSHYITLAVAVSLIFVLYRWGNTIPEKKAPKNTGAPMAAANGQQMPPQHAVASVDSVIEASKSRLPQHAAKEVADAEQKLSGITDSAKMAPVFATLATIWQEHKILPVAAYYYAKEAKLVDSEKKLNFAGRFFLELTHDEKSPEMQAWEAQEAIACLKRSTEINPDNDTIKMALASGYVEATNEPMSGIQILLGIVREKPENVPANLMLGRMAIQSGQFDKALGRFETVLKKEPENTEAMYFLAETYKGLGKKEKAIALLEECKKLVNNPAFTKDIDEYIKTF